MCSIRLVFPKTVLCFIIIPLRYRYIMQIKQRIAVIRPKGWLSDHRRLPAEMLGAGAPCFSVTVCQICCTASQKCSPNIFWSSTFKQFTCRTYNIIHSHPSRCHSLEDICVIIQGICPKHITIIHQLNPELLARRIRIEVSASGDPIKVIQAQFLHVCIAKAYNSANLSGSRCILQFLFHFRC